MNPHAQLVDPDRFLIAADRYPNCPPKQGQPSKAFQATCGGAEGQVDSVGWSAPLVPFEGAHNGSGHIAAR
jgi:hypothetical protein